MKRLTNMAASLKTSRHEKKTVFAGKICHEGKEYNHFVDRSLVSCSLSKRLSLSAQALYSLYRKILIVHSEFSFSMSTFVLFAFDPLCVYLDSRLSFRAVRKLRCKTIGFHRQARSCLLKGLLVLQPSTAHRVTCLANSRLGSSFGPIAKSTETS